MSRRELEEARREVAAALKEAGHEVAGAVLEVRRALNAELPAAPVDARAERKRLRQALREARREARRARELAWPRRRARFFRHLEAYALVNAFLVGMWFLEGGRGEFWPAAVMMGWGLGLAFHALKTLRHRGEARAASAAEEDVAEEGVPEKEAEPVLAPVPAVSPEVAALRERVAAVAAPLRAHGRRSLAEALEQGLLDAEELLAFRAGLALDADEADARREAARLHEKAAGARDPEARRIYEEGAALARGRLGKLEGLRAEDERAEARVEAFHQQVRSFEVDLARLRTGDADPSSALDGGTLEREVEALHRTREELRRLHAAVRSTVR